VLLAELADRVELTAGLSEALASTRERRSAHAPGRVLRDVAVMLADGGDCVTDLEGLRGQQRLFGPVASETTAHRTLRAIDETLLAGVRRARAAGRARAWDAGARPDTLTLDIDATLLTAHSEKDGAAGNYKHGFGFHPIGCWLAETGEALAAVLRPGNAGSNTAEDHFQVLSLALAQLPEQDLGRELLVRTVSAVARTRSPATAGTPGSASRSATPSTNRSAARSSKSRTHRGSRRLTATARPGTARG
jgi:hypothetical protein